MDAKTSGAMTTARGTVERVAGVSLHEEFTRMVVAKKAAMIDASLREALGQWVSEVEPEIVNTPDGLALGIGALGHGNPIVPIRKTELILTCGGVEYGRI